MGPEFFQTGMRKTFFNGQLPSLINAIVSHTEAVNRLADAIEKSNEIAAKNSENN